MAQYLLAIYPYRDPALTEEEFRQTCEDVPVLVDELAAAGGELVFGDGLNPTLPSTVIRFVDGETEVTEGPFAERKDVLGGFWVIRVGSYEAACEWGAKLAAACRHTVEVNPFEDDDSTIEVLFDHAVKMGLGSRG